MQSERLDFSQPKNDLTAIADLQRKSLIVKNDYKTVNPYSSVNPDAISDGDESGKGTGIFLDTINGGSSIDIVERKNEIKINKFNSTKPYPNFAL